MKPEYDIGLQEPLAINDKRLTFHRHRLPSTRTKRLHRSYQKTFQRNYEPVHSLSDENSAVFLVYFDLLHRQNLVRQQSILRPSIHPKTRIAAWKPAKSSKLDIQRPRLNAQPLHRFEGSRIDKVESIPNEQSSVMPEKASSSLQETSDQLVGACVARPSACDPAIMSIPTECTTKPIQTQQSHTYAASPSLSASSNQSITFLKPEFAMAGLAQHEAFTKHQDVQQFSLSSKAIDPQVIPQKRKTRTSCRRIGSDDAVCIEAKKSKYTPGTSVTKATGCDETVDICCPQHDLNAPQKDSCTSSSMLTDALKSSRHAADEGATTLTKLSESATLNRFFDKLEQHYQPSQDLSTTLDQSCALIQTPQSSRPGDSLPNLEQDSNEINSRKSRSYVRSRSGITQHTSSHDSPAPSPPTKRGGRNNTGRGRTGYTNGRNRGRGRGGAGGGAGGGRDRGDSPDPPIKHILTPEERATMSHIRARQLELKRFFTIVGGQQREILDALAARDLAKLTKKSKAHTKVPEYDELCADVDEKMHIAQDLAQKRLEIGKEHLEKAWSDEKRIIEEQFQTRIFEAKQEHVKGAEGDLIIFKNAHRAANDDTGTEAGSDVGTYPRYHECPEPDSRIRGYSSTQITDEKSLKQQLASYDEQAQREVLDDDVVEPQNQSMAEQQFIKEDEEGHLGKDIDELVLVAESELKRIEIPPPPPTVYPTENPQFALSRLADASELVLRQQRERALASVPITPVEIPKLSRGHIMNDMHVPPPPSLLPPIQQNMPIPAVPIVKKPTPRRQKKTSTNTKQAPHRTEQPDVTTSSVASSLPAIAPAPARMPPPPPSPMHTLPRPPPMYPMAEYPITPYAQSMPPLPPPPPPPQQTLSPRRPSQQFTFAPTQTPGQQYFSPTTPDQAFHTGPAPVATQSKMHNTFVNQTVESRHQADIARQNAARTQGQGMGPRGGKRILLPKV